MYHKPALLNESISGLNINPNGIYIDVTFGGGGHSKEILKHLSSKGQLFALDQDPDSVDNIINDNRFKLIRGNFRYIKNFINYYGIEKVDGIIADLGVSSHQFDTMERGFSFRLGGSLDMRMNLQQKISAADILNDYNEGKLYYIFKNYCDIPNPGRLVPIILNYRTHGKFSDIETFLDIISPILPKHREVKYLAQVFQALRIEVNDEMNSLKEFLDIISVILKQGGRISIISYHSLEDKLVKNLIKSGNSNGIEKMDIFGKTDNTFKAINRQVIVPSEDEILQNSRAKSAKLRIAEKL
jgi:16S rRNA (cytosine1402-N4)-methyltransferase